MILVRVLVCVRVCANAIVSVGVGACEYVSVHYVMCRYYGGRLGCIVVSCACMGQG